MTAALALTVAAFLIGAGVSHLRHPGATVAAVRAHRVVAVTSGVLTAGVWLLGLAEILLGAVVAYGGVGGGDTVVYARSGGLLAAAIFVGFAGYAALATARATGRSVPCGCGVGESPMGGWVATRAAILAVMALVTALAVNDTPVSARGAAEVVIIGCAAVTVFLGLRGLPQARTVLAPVAAEGVR